MNDRDAFLCNVWRALAADPAGVADWCRRPPDEAEVHAVHTWLVAQRETFTARLMGDPDYYNVRVAGRWLYGICAWIGSGWCSGRGPWQSVDGHLVHLGDAGRGVHRQRLHLGDAGQEDGLLAWFTALQDRLRRVRMCCGDWERVLGPSVTTKFGMTGVVLDPPYSTEEDRDPELYAVDDLHVAHAVRAWCLEHGNNPQLRMALCGYGDVHDALLTAGWTKQTWKASGGMGSQGHGRGRANAQRETLWFSPACVPIDAVQPDLFAQTGGLA